MGEVYRARDTRLGRGVALKFPPAELASDAERLARFDREARLLASLNHPNIGTIHGLEGSDATSCLVLELVPCETLAEKIAGGPLPLVRTSVATRYGRAAESSSTRTDRFMAVEILGHKPFSASTPHLLFEARYERPPGPLPNYDVSLITGVS